MRNQFHEYWISDLAVLFLLLQPPESIGIKSCDMATTADMRSGLIIKVDGSLYTVIEFGQNKTARAAAKVWAKLKGVDNNRTIEVTWNRERPSSR